LGTLKFCMCKQQGEEHKHNNNKSSSNRHIPMTILSWLMVVHAFFLYFLLLLVVLPCCRVFVLHACMYTLSLFPCIYLLCTFCSPRCPIGFLYGLHWVQLCSGLVLKETNEDHTLPFASLEKKVYSPIAHRGMNALQGERMEEDSER